MFTLANLLNEAGPLDAHTEAQLERLAAGVREGHFGRLNVDGRDLFLHRLSHGVWRLTGTAGERPTAVRLTIGQAGPLLWRELEQGAATPQLRRALAVGMTTRLPCGPCARHWHDALLGLREEDCATAEAFDRWVSDQHNLVNQRIGKPLWPEGY